MKNLAIIGASYLQLPLIEKAKESGYTTHVFSWIANDVGEMVADYFYPINIVEKEKITEKCKEIGICGVCSIASDLAVITVNFVANKLGLVGNSMESSYRSTNKHLMRLAFEKGGDPSPKSILVGDNTDLNKLDLQYPIIVKPVDRSGSRGICKLETPANLKSAIRFALNQSFIREALVEEYVGGQEYSVEGISYQGEHHILAITCKYTTGAPYFIEMGHMEPASVSGDEFIKIKEVVVHALDTLGIMSGASHSEIKISEDGEIKIIEIGGRMGGDCIGSDLVYYSTGVDYLKAVIDVACGKNPDLKKTHEGFPCAVKYILNDRDVQEMEHAKLTKEFIRLVYYNPENIGYISDSSNRAGCYILKV